MMPHLIIPGKNLPFGVLPGVFEMRHYFDDMFFDLSVQSKREIFTLLLKISLCQEAGTTPVGDLFQKRSEQLFL